MLADKTMQFSMIRPGSIAINDKKRIVKGSVLGQFNQSHADRDIVDSGKFRNFNAR
jgi:hypothetical protein